MTNSTVAFGIQGKELNINSSCGKSNHLASLLFAKETHIKTKHIEQFCAPIYAPRS